MRRHIYCNFDRHTIVNENKKNYNNKKLSYHRDTVYDVLCEFCQLLLMRYVASYLSKVDFFYPTYLAPLLQMTPLEYHQDVWCQKTISLSSYAWLFA